MEWYIVRFETFRGGERYLDLVRMYFRAWTEVEALEEYWRLKRKMQRYHEAHPDQDYDLPREIDKLVERARA